MVRTAAQHQGMPVTSDPATQDLSIAQIASLLVQRWRVVLAGAIIGVLAGAAVLAFVAPTYRFTSVIEIARVAQDPLAGLVQPVEAVESAVSKLDGAIIPAELRALVEAFPARSRLSSIRLKATAGQAGGAIVALESSGPQTDADVHVRLHTGVVASLAKTHEQPLALAHQQIGRELATLLLKKEEQVQKLEGSKRLDDLIAPGQLHLTAQIAALKQDIDTAERQRAQVGSADDSARALAGMLIDQAQEQNRLRVASLEDRLERSLKSQQQDQTLERGEITRTLKQLEVDESLLRTRLSDVIPTRAIMAPQQSLRPIGLSIGSLSALMVLAGLAAGMIAGVIMPVTTPREA